MNSVMARADAILSHLEGENPKVAEIGVSKGRLSRLLRQRTSNLYLIDSWQEATSESYIATHDDHAMLTQKRHDKNYQLASEVDAIIIRKDSVEASKDFEDGFFDLIFIDADHSYEGCSRDIKAWLPKVRIGGWLSGHDYGDRQFGVTQAVDELLSNVELDKNLTWFYANNNSI